MRPLHRFLHSFRHAGRGLGFALREQRNFRVHVAAAVGVTALGGGLRISSVEWLFLVLAMGLVLTAELLNSGLECLGDAITREHNSLIGKAKDLGAAAVLISALAAAILGSVIFVPKLWTLLAPR